MMHCCSTVCIFHAFNVLAQVLVILGASTKGYVPGLHDKLGL